MDIFQFMSDSPVLTFFILLIVAELIVKSIRAFKGVKDED